MNERRKALNGSRNRQKGISYIEIVIATAILSISLVPAMEALQSAQLGSQINSDMQSQHYALLEKFELTLAEPFFSLDAEAVQLANENTLSSVYSDAASLPQRRLVYIQRYDADNADGDGNPFTGGDENILWIKVEVAGTALSKETLITSL